MSPEQAKGMPVTPSTDLYALGVVMYESLAGQAPFEAENYHQLLFTIVEGNPPKLNDLCPGVDETFLQLVERAMAPNASDRFENATKMREALAPFAAMGVQRAGGSHKGASSPNKKSDTDPLAATVTPQQVTPLAFDATMAPEAEETREGAAPAARSLHPEPSRRPWMALVALVAVVALGAGAFAALQEPEDEDVTTAAAPQSPVTPERVEQGTNEPAENESANEVVDQAAPAEAVTASDDTETARPTDAPSVRPARNNTGAPPANTGRPHQSAMHAASMNVAPSAMSTERRIMAPCGSGEHEMFLVRPSDRIVIEGGAGGGVGLRTNVFLDRIQTRADAITRCFRGKHIRRGQDVHVTLDANGHVTNVRLREWCPIPAEARRCAERHIATLDFSDLNATAGEGNFNFDMHGL
ncbi:MAG: hypothetical protein ACI9KE_002562 [Polyangiales bacterium]|jgi:hypothetical protein